MRRTSDRRVRRGRQGVRYALFAVVGWTALTALAIGVELGRSDAAVRAAAELQARNSFETLRIVRRWNARFGGVFVPVSDTLRPSPWLTHVPDRAARTEGGRELTLMNPAWMTRQILELANQELQITGHITSLKPLRPENAPDPWERSALERLEAGADEYSEVAQGPGGPRLLYMGKLTAEHSCLRCHAEQIDRVGEVRGGIAISVPLAPFSELGTREGRRQLAVHAFIWLLGLLGILLALRDHRRLVAAEVASEDRQAKAEAELSAARRLEAVGRLSSGLAHDFNNLLAPVLSVSGLVRDELPPDSPLRADLEEIRSAASKARELVRALQTLSRKNGAHLERIPLERLVRENEELLRRFAGPRLGFVLRVGEGVPIVQADRPLLELALANLVAAAREGGVHGRTIGMDVAATDLSDDEAARLRVQPGRHAAVTVAEAGTLGAPFAPFSPLHGDASESSVGAFGLATINGIVAQYGGAVVVRETSGTGWIVRLLLPEAPSEAGAGDASSA